MIELDDFLGATGIERQVLELWIEREWLVAERQRPTLVLTDTDAARARFIQELTRDLGVNDEGVELVLHLLDQVHGLRQAMTQMRGELEAGRRRDRRRRIGSTARTRRRGLRD
jgi:chaperone modulatory protein CbpM